MKNQYQRILFGLKVRELRQEQKMSFADLSKRAKMSISYLNEIEKGKKYPKEDKITALAKALGTNAERITSFELSPNMMPVAELLRSNFLSELPLDRFGISLQKVVEMISGAPVRVGAFVSTLVELSRNYALQEDNFYFGAMRSYQELHYNYFEDIEVAAEAFVKKHGLEVDNISAADLEAILRQHHGCGVNNDQLALHPELGKVHSVSVPKENRLLIQAAANESQRALLIGRELGFRTLQPKERPFYSPLRSPQSFEPVLGHFKATYFATAIMMNQHRLAKAVERFCNRPTWDGDALVDIIKSYNVTPEMFVHRLTNILPQFFQLKQLFFIRVRTLPDSGRYTIDKVLHLNQRHHPHSNKIYEHYCRRWVSVDALREMHRLRGDSGEGRIIARAQRSRYHGTDDEYLCITVVIPAGPLQSKDISVTFGILMDDWLRKVVRFTADPAIPFRVVNKTCERCPIMDCAERAARPYVHEQRQEWDAMQRKLEDLTGR